MTNPRPQSISFSKAERDELVEQPFEETPLWTALEDALDEQIGYHLDMEIEAPWTEEYRAGYVDGLRLARDVVISLLAS